MDSPKASKRDRTRPLELLGMSVILAVFIFLVVLMGTREPLVALEFAGIAFIVGVVVLAMLSLAARPTGPEQADIDEQNDDAAPDEKRPPLGH